MAPALPITFAAHRGSDSFDDEPELHYSVSVEGRYVGRVMREGSRWVAIGNDRVRGPFRSRCAAAESLIRFPGPVPA